jgi:hypothetical protein
MSSKHNNDDDDDNNNNNNNKYNTLSEVFTCISLSCKANARVKLAKTGHGRHSSRLVVCVLLLFVLFHVLFVCKCVLYYGHQVTTQLQLKNISITSYAY